LKAKTIKIILFLFFIFLVCPPLSRGEDKVYTNKDLQKYQDVNTSSITVVNGGTITYEELMRRAPKMKPLCTDEMKAKWKARGGGCGEEEVDFPTMWKKPPERPGLRDDEQVNVSIRGCQTLQESLDGKSGSTNDRTDLRYIRARM
jgi:hypothetical protein